MKSILKYSLIVIVVICSCDDSFLDRDPLDAIGEEYYWKTAADLENYVVQFYPSFPSHDGNYRYGYPVRNADNAITGTPNPVLNGERGIVGGRWISDWRRIRSINIFFDNYKKCEDDFEIYKHYLGEAHFFRAWFYFELVKKYGNVPWYSKQLFPNSNEELQKSRTPRTQIIDSILLDLERAEEYLELRSRVGNSRINKEFALAFQTRVALFEGTWQKYHAQTPFGTNGADPNRYFKICVDAALKLQNGSYTVGIHDNYYEMFGLDDMSGIDEILFYKHYNQSDGLSNDMQYATTVYPGELGATWSLITSFLNKQGQPYDYQSLATTVKGNAFLSRIANDVDSRLNSTIWAPDDLQVSSTGKIFIKPDIAGAGLTLNPTGFQIKKGSNPDSPGAGKGGGGNSETGYIIMRYGEVLLNYAEALLELNGTVAYDALDQLRTRCGMPEFKIISQTNDPNLLDYGYSISDELYEIRRERRVELGLEGHRYDDYRRWAAHALFKNKRPKGYPFDSAEYPEYSPPLDEIGLIDYFKFSLPAGYQFREDQDYLSPIPVEELTLNPNLEQNPGW